MALNRTGMPVCVSIRETSLQYCCDFRTAEKKMRTSVSRYNNTGKYEARINTWFVANNKRAFGTVRSALLQYFWQKTAFGRSY